MMVSETLQRLMEHFPDHARAIPFFVAATRYDDDSPSIRVDVKTLITALIVALVTGIAGAAWATYSTTKELGIQFAYLSRQIEATSKKVEEHNAAAIADRQAIFERIIRIEAMNGMSGTENRKR